MTTTKNQFEQLAALLDDAVILLDGAGTVTRANQQAFEFLGKHIAGYPLDWFLRHPDFKSALQSTRGDGVVNDLSYTRMDQVRRAFKIRLAPFDDGHVLCRISDDTSQVGVDRIRADFVANVSHELRSPLTALNGFIETLQDGAIEDLDARDNFLSIMKMEADRMQRLISDLLSLSSVEASEHNSPDGTVDIDHILADTVSVLAPRAEARKIELIISYVEAPAELGSTIVKGVYDELRQVFQNLIENALRYGFGDSVVEVRIGKGNTAYGELRDDLLRVQVINQGETIAPEHVARLTERFYRIDKGRSREMGGTGLGLAIVKHIVNRHRGRLRVTSEGGETCFSVTLPRA